jgi:periplasmic divalent cation tolerance protein
MTKPASSAQNEVTVVLITAGSRDEAVRIAEMLVGAHLAACVQILPEMESIYRWQGSVRRDAEFLMLVKTSTDCFDLLEATVRDLHSYETPEIIALPIIKGSHAYLKWLDENLINPLATSEE